MFYPGQAVYSTEDKGVGIYVGYDLDTRYPYAPFMYVFMYEGKNGVDSTTSMYSPKFLKPITKPDKKSLTGQTCYVTPFQRPSLSRVFYDKEIEDLSNSFIEEMNKIIRFKWFKAQFELNTEIKKD